MTGICIFWLQLSSVLSCLILLVVIGCRFAAAVHHRLMGAPAQLFGAWQSSRHDTTSHPHSEPQFSVTIVCSGDSLADYLWLLSYLCWSPSPTPKLLIVRLCWSLEGGQLHQFMTTSGEFGFWPSGGNASRREPMGRRWQGGNVTTHNCALRQYSGVRLR